VESTAGNGPPGAAVSRILVVEDEFLIAMEMEAMLIDGGFRVIGPVATVAAALAIIEKEPPDAAVLDVSLRGERVTPVASVLRAMSVPFVLASAFDPGELNKDAALAGVLNIGKPAVAGFLLKALRDILDRGGISHPQSQGAK
jgi:DNA-binding response OmpR family regulator